MADFLDLTGDYETDFPRIQQMFKDIVERMNVGNWEGEEITHQFTTTGNESISHKLEKIPTRIVGMKQESAQATVEWVSATDTTITLKASDSALKLTFYIE